MTHGRSAGILLHPTSLPGAYGIGDLGPEALRFIDVLAEAGMRRWQILPLGPTGYGDSPYQCFSAFAGNPLLISPELLARDGLLTAADLASMPAFDPARVEFGPLITWKLGMLTRAHAAFRAGRAPAWLAEFERFQQSNAAWLGDYALFMALKQRHGGYAWPEWDAPLVTRDPAAMASARVTMAESIEREAFAQFVFFRQWAAVRAHARSRGVSVIGDLPIFVAHDSSDVWANPGLFMLDERGQCTVVAGVPPDYFSTTGQRWGNPLYRWDVSARSGHAWWIERLRAAFALVDIVRIDHFRGFEAYWEIPAGEPTAVKGRWFKGPGASFFEAARAALGTLPIIAEDLGVITPGVVALRENFALPGMRVLQFAFGGDHTNGYLPHHHTPRGVVYTGTHDNDTTRGWYAHASEAERDRVRLYLGRDGQDIAWDLIRTAFASVADTAIVPLQDVLDLGSEARMNLPGTCGGWWSWRFTWPQVTELRLARLRSLAGLYSRLAEPAPKARKTETRPASATADSATA